MIFNIVITALLFLLFVFAASQVPKLEWDKAAVIWGMVFHLSSIFYGYSLYPLLEKIDIWRKRKLKGKAEKKGGTACN